VPSDDLPAVVFLPFAQGATRSPCRRQSTCAQLGAIVQRFGGEFKKLLLIALMEDWDKEIGAGCGGNVGAVSELEH
jgi:hypothetical protein